MRLQGARDSFVPKSDTKEPAILESLMEPARLSQLNPAAHSTVVHYGAVEHTSARNFLIAVSLDEFDAMGRRYLGVTLQAPVIQALLGRSVGERVIVNGVTYTVEAIV